MNSETIQEVVVVSEPNPRTIIHPQPQQQIQGGLVHPLPPPAPRKQRPVASRRHDLEGKLKPRCLFPEEQMGR